MRGEGGGGVFSLNPLETPPLPLGSHKWPTVGNTLSSAKCKESCLLAKNKLNDVCACVYVCVFVCAWLKFHFNVIGITQEQAGETLMKCIVK